MILLGFTLQEIKDIALISTPFVSFYFSSRSFNRLSAKDRKDLDYKLIDKSYEEAEKLESLLKDLLETETQEGFSKFISFLQHISVSILADTVHEKVFKYKYAPLLKILFTKIPEYNSNDYIEAMHKKLDLPFYQEDYQWLYDVYKLGIKKGFIKK
jgi:hypothetical protein